MVKSRITRYLPAVDPAFFESGPRSLLVGFDLDMLKNPDLLPEALVEKPKADKPMKAEKPVIANPKKPADTDNAPEPSDEPEEPAKEPEADEPDTEEPETESDETETEPEASGNGEFDDMWGEE